MDSRRSRHPALLMLTMLLSLASRAAGFSLPTPEQVVSSQLHHLQKADIRTAYEDYFSELSKQGTGNSWRSFAEELEDEAFAHIVNHSKADVMMVVDHGDDTCSCLVRVVSKNQLKNNPNVIPLQYWWGLIHDEGIGWKVENLLPDFESTDLDNQAEEGDISDLFLYTDEDGNILEIDDDDEDGTGWFLL